jgi:hypothetical protein
MPCALDHPINAPLPLLRSLNLLGLVLLIPAELQTFSTQKEAVNVVDVQLIGLFRLHSYSVSDIINSNENRTYDCD